MGSDAGDLITASDEITNKLCRRPLPSAEDKTKKFIRQSPGVTEVFDRVLG
ncbi:hypothetical protein IWX62_003046 [Arthrobacter sp. CAN_A1]